MAAAIPGPMKFPHPGLAAMLDLTFAVDFVNDFFFIDNLNAFLS